jgi:TRAP-type transport system periplasmic protein
MQVILLERGAILNSASDCYWKKDNGATKPAAQAIKEEEEEKMKSHGIGFSIFVVLVVALLCYGGSAYGQQKVTKITFSTLFPAAHKQGVLATEWAKDVEQKTNGAVKVTVFHGGTLTPPDKAYDGVVKGISDAALAPLSYTVGRFPMFEVFDYPMGYKSSVAATKLSNELYRKYKPKEFDDVHVMYFITPAMAGVHANKMVQKLEDMKGLKLRSTGVTAKVVSHLGGVPVALPIGETYDAAKRGIIDGVVSLIEALQGWKFAEVTKYTTETPSANTSVIFAIVINKSVWNALSPDLKTTIDKINEEFMEKSGRAWGEMEESAREFSLKLGHKFIRLPDAEEEARWAKALAPLYDEYVKEKTAKGIPAAEVLKYCRDRLKQLQ